MKATNSLPPAVKNLIERKLSFRRRQLDKQVIDLKHRLLATQLRKGAQTAIGGAAGSLEKSALDVYREFVTELSALAGAWPVTVAREAIGIIERASVGPIDSAEIGVMVDAHAWPVGGAPFFLQFTDPRQFIEAIDQWERQRGRRGGHGESSSGHAIRLAASAAEAGIWNRGRASREEAAIAIDEFAVVTMSAHGHQAVETPDERRERLRAAVNAERAKGTKAFVKVVAVREGIGVRRLHEILAGKRPTTGVWDGLGASQRRKKR